MADPTPGPTRESEAPDPAALVKRYERLLSRRGQVDIMQQELAEYIIPRKGVITVQRGEGQEQTERVWDSTAIHANEILAASIQGSLMSASIRWFSLALRDPPQPMPKPATDWLEQVEEHIYLGLRQSNFNAEVGEICLDLGAFGVGALFVDERPLRPGQTGFGGFRFIAVAPGTYVVAEDPDGRVDTVIRSSQMTARQIHDAFGDEGTLPEPIRNAVMDHPDKEFEVLHAVYPRKVQNLARIDAKHKPWASCYLDRRTKTVLSEGGYDELCYLVPRWAKTSGEVYGRGPGHTALPDIRTLSRAIELVLSAASKAMDPPGLVNSDAVFGELDIRPASQNPVDGDPRLAWSPMESGAKFDVSQVLKQELKQSIQHVFFWEQLQLQGDRLMTATEVERRLELMRRILGPTLGRFESELLTPLLQRCFGLMWRAGVLPPPPSEIQGQNLDVEYEGPLARSQKATRIAGVEQWLSLMTPVAQFQQARGLPDNVLDNADFDAIFRDGAVVAGWPSTYLVDPETRDELRQAARAAAAQQRQMDQMAQIAEAAGKAAPGLTALDTAAQNGRGFTEAPA